MAEHLSYMELFAGSIPVAATPGAPMRIGVPIFIATKPTGPGNTLITCG